MKYEIPILVILQSAIKSIQSAKNESGTDPGMKDTSPSYEDWE